MHRLRDPIQAEVKRIKAACLMRQLAKDGYGWEDIVVKIAKKGLSESLSREKIKAYVLTREEAE